MVVSTFDNFITIRFILIYKMYLRRKKEEKIFKGQKKLQSTLAKQEKLLDIWGIDETKFRRFGTEVLNWLNTMQ